MLTETKASVEETIDQVSTLSFFNDLHIIRKL